MYDKYKYNDFLTNVSNSPNNVLTLLLIVILYFMIVFYCVTESLDFSGVFC